MNYYERVQKSIDYIEENINSELQLEVIASKAYMSIANFYRLFYAFTGHSVKDYIRRRRLFNASKDIIYTNEKLIDISLKYLFDSPESFSRAFKKEYGKTPSDFRKTGWQPETFERMDIMENNFIMTSQELEQYPDIKVMKELPPMEIAYFTGQGYRAELDSLEALMKWAKDNSLDKKGFRIFGFDNGRFGLEHKYETWFAFNENVSQHKDERIRFKTFSGGQYAVMSTRLKDIVNAWDRFCGWVKNSRYDFGTLQCLEEILPGNDDDINEETRIDLYMSLQPKQVKTIGEPVGTMADIKPVITKKDAMTITGIKCDTNLQDNRTNYTAAKLWDRFNKKENRRIRDVLDSEGAYGVFIPFPKYDGDYSYVAGFYTKDDTSVPDGMVSQALPPSTYAVFTYRSPVKNKFDMSNVPDMYNQIFCRWLPQSEYEYNSNGSVYEYYQRPRMTGDYPEYDICVPVIKK